MLPKEKRLNLKKDFKWVASGSPRSAGGAGKKVSTKYANLFLRVGDNQNPRVGIATSSSIFKKSSQRNKARRLLSAAFESLYNNLPDTINIVALPKIGILDVKSGDVLMDLEEALKKEKIL